MAVFNIRTEKIDKVEIKKTEFTIATSVELDNCGKENLFASLH